MLTHILASLLYLSAIATVFFGAWEAYARRSAPPYRILKILTQKVSIALLLAGFGQMLRLLLEILQAVR
jgi:TRAP-type C4-dicarboxylate transport system permease small subunit